MLTLVVGLMFCQIETMRHAIGFVLQLTDTQYDLEVREKCNMDMFRVMAINRFGTSGYSKPIELPGNTDRLCRS